MIPVQKRRVIAVRHRFRKWTASLTTRRRTTLTSLRPSRLRHTVSYWSVLGNYFSLSRALSMLKCLPLDFLLNSLSLVRGRRDSTTFKTRRDLYSSKTFFWKSLKRFLVTDNEITWWEPFMNHPSFFGNPCLTLPWCCESSSFVRIDMAMKERLFKIAKEFP